MKEGEVIPISDKLKSQYREWGHYSQMQCIGSNLSFTLLMSILDCLLANNNIEKLKTLVNPKKPYTSNAQEIAQKIQSCILDDRNFSKFYHQASINDPQFIRAAALLFEFCNYPNQTLIGNLIQKVFTLSKVFELSFCIFGDYILKVDTQKPMIFIYFKDNQYYYIKQFDENQQSNMGQIKFSKCQEQHHQDQNSKPNNFDIDHEINHLFKFKVFDVYNESENRIDTKIIPIQQINQKDVVDNQMEHDNLQDNSTKSVQACMNCNETTSTPLFVNKACNHQFCQKCLNQRIPNFEINYQCLNRDCSSLIDLLSYNTYCSGDVSVNKREEIIQLELKSCSNCGKNELKKKQILESSKNTLCRECFKKSTTNLEQQYISKQQQNCLEKIDGNNLKEKEHSILFECSKCQVKMNRKQQFLNNNCFHLLCFSCSNDLILKENTTFANQYRCPVSYCYQYLNQPNFNNFFEEKQKALLQEQEMQETEKKQDIFIEPLEQISQQQNNGQQMEIQMTEEEENHYQTYGQCTLCFTGFSTYNRRQKLDCKSHQIGVCCSLMNYKCPQCSGKKIDNSNVLNNITDKFKLKKDGKQTVDIYSMQIN